MYPIPKLLSIKRNKQNVFIFLYIFVISVFLYYRFAVTESKFSSITLRKYILEHHNHMINNEIPSHENLLVSEEIIDKKYILFWTKFWNLPAWYLGSQEAGYEMLKLVNCPMTNCFFTHNKSYLLNPTQFDAIVFHGAEYLKADLPRERSSSQLYVMANLESPMLTFEVLARFPNFFNLTMTYRFDSDIFWSYGKMIDIVTDKIIAPSRSVEWKQPDEDYFDENIYQEILKKKKAAAWFTSNCNSNSNREKLAKQLKKFINVDIFGKCGKSVCKKNSTNCKTSLLNSKYMFYLSFENALCTDYVTEKLFMPLSIFIIPVVFNAANTSFYAPPKSYIDANDFDSVEDLSNYLKYLMDNPREYIKYFWWKKHYKVMYELPSFQTGFCDLCVKLNDQNFRNKKHVYSNINDWWHEGMCTSEPRIKF